MAWNTRTKKPGFTAECEGSRLLANEGMGAGGFEPPKA